MRDRDGTKVSGNPNNRKLAYPDDQQQSSQQPTPGSSSRNNQKQEMLLYSNDSQKALHRGGNSQLLNTNQTGGNQTQRIQLTFNFDQIANLKNHDGIKKKYSNNMATNQTVQLIRWQEVPVSRGPAQQRSKDDLRDDRGRNQGGFTDKKMMASSQRVDEGENY